MGKASLTFASGAALVAVLAGGSAAAAGDATGSRAARQAPAQVSITPSTATAGGSVEVAWKCTDSNAISVHDFQTGGALPSLEGSPWDKENKVKAKVADKAPGKYTVTVNCQNTRGQIVQSGSADLTIEKPTPPVSPKGKVVSHINLHIRAGVDAKARVVGKLRPRQVVNLECKTPGQNIRGNRLWYKLANRDSAWVAARYVKNLNHVPLCPVG